MAKNIPQFEFSKMKQHHENYTSENHEVWNLLYDRQIKNLEGKACKEYLEAHISLQPQVNNQFIPNFNEVDEKLLATTGWEIQVVPGLIPVEEFFALLAQKVFCSSTWLRSKAQLDYLEEPDMFHDTFGHIPLLINPLYADFMHQFGVLGEKYKADEQKVIMLKRLYWFTIEFGLIQTKSDEKVKIYGAGLLSSFGETNHIYDEEIEIKPFDLIEVMNTPFQNDVIQNLYFCIPSFEFLFQQLELADKILYY